MQCSSEVKWSVSVASQAHPNSTIIVYWICSQLTLSNSVTECKSYEKCNSELCSTIMIKLDAPLLALLDTELHKLLTHIILNCKQAFVYIAQTFPVFII